jgi:hypothetical protein
MEVIPEIQNQDKQNEIWHKQTLGIQSETARPSIMVYLHVGHLRFFSAEISQAVTDVAHFFNLPPRAEANYNW